MIQHQGIYLPDGETHLTAWMTNSGEIVDGRGTYQIKKLREALKWVRAWRAAVDVGAHVGMWSMQLAKRFASVHAFEPVAAHRECFRHNVLPDDWEGSADNPEAEAYHASREGHSVWLNPFALGEKDGFVTMHTAPTSSGDSWVDGEGDIPMKRLDEFDLQDVDFIKLDCEGYELFALRGAEETLKRCRPCVIVEQKPGRAQKFGLEETQALDYLRGMGAHLRAAISGDYVLSFD